MCSLSSDWLITLLSRAVIGEMRFLKSSFVIVRLRYFSTKFTSIHLKIIHIGFVESLKYACFDQFCFYDNYVLMFALG